MPQDHSMHQIAHYYLRVSEELEELARVCAEAAGYSQENIDYSINVIKKRDGWCPNLISTNATRR